MSERGDGYEEVEVTTLEERLRLAVTVAFHEGYREGLSERRLFGAYKFDADRAAERVVGLLHAIRVLSVENRVVIRRAPSPTTEGVEASAPAGAPEEPVLDGHLIGDAPESSSAPTEPTPAALREWAEWFEGTERVVVPTEAGLNHPSDLLRRIADAMEGR